MLVLSPSPLMQFRSAGYIQKWRFLIGKSRFFNRKLHLEPYAAKHAWPLGEWRLSWHYHIKSTFYWENWPARSRQVSDKWTLQHMARPDSRIFNTRPSIFQYKIHGEPSFRHENAPPPGVPHAGWEIAWPAHSQTTPPYEIPPTACWSPCVVPAVT